MKFEENKSEINIESIDEPIKETKKIKKKNGYLLLLKILQKLKY